MSVFEVRNSACAPVDLAVETIPGTAWVTPSCDIEKPAVPTTFTPLSPAAWMMASRPSVSAGVLPDTTMTLLMPRPLP